MDGAKKPMYICPRCGRDMYFWDNENIVCIDCGYEPMIKTNFTAGDSANACVADKEAEFLKMVRERYAFNSDVFDKDLYQKVIDEEYSLDMAVRASRRRREQQTQSQPQIKCPTCGSTSVRRIGSGERAASIFGFGLFSRKARKTFKCNDCGYMW